MSDPSCFITGTDTGVGKTIVCAALVSAHRALGRDVVPMKPVQTGDADDLAICLRAAAISVDDVERQRMNPYRFRLAASPHLAAAREGAVVSIDRICGAYEELLSHHDGVIVEGAGGVLTPLTESSSILDLMTALGLPVVVVARPGLGTLNHTLLTVRELRRAKLEIRAIYLNETRSGAWGEIEEDNLRTLRRIAGVVTVARLAYAPPDHGGIPEIDIVALLDRF